MFSPLYDNAYDLVQAYQADLLAGAQAAGPGHVLRDRVLLWDRLLDWAGDGLIALGRGLKPAHPVEPMPVKISVQH